MISLVDPRTLILIAVSAAALILAFFSATLLRMAGVKKASRYSSLIMIPFAGSLLADLILVFVLLWLWGVP